MKNLIILCLTIFSPWIAISQNLISGTYKNVNSVSGTILKLKKDRSFTYYIYSDMLGKLSFGGVYVMHGSTLKLIFKTPNFKQKNQIFYESTSDSLLNIQLVDQNENPLIAASALINGNIRATSDTNGLIKLNKEIEIKKLTVKFPGIKDIEFLVKEKGHHKIKIKIADLETHSTIYDLVIPKWKISSNKLLLKDYSSGKYVLAKTP